ncbi:MAG: alpha/beta fold hydrolase [Capsulimonadales bacterium]|nr:alpha/beta fold hydrolase [Capsulimonadales bacterium]
MLREGTTTLSFAEACERAKEFDREEADALQPTGHTRLFVHDGPTDRVAVLYHGITNNPLQWEAFGLALQAGGWNVLIPRLPYHGYRDRMTELPGRLDAPAMRRYISESIAVAQGLGERVAVAGLSAGGVYAAWAAQERSIARAIVIAPLFSPKYVPLACVPFLSTIFRRLPNHMQWWNEQAKTAHIPPHAYPRFSTRNLAETLLLGEEVYRKARRTPPCCRDIRILNNAIDRSVSNVATAQAVAAWEGQGATVRTHLLAASEGLPHDVIDPTQPKANLPLVYGLLREMLDGI